MDNSIVYFNCNGIINKRAELTNAPMFPRAGLLRYVRLQ